MTDRKWTVTYMIHRKKGEGKAHFDSFSVEVRPDEYVLDGIERIWAFQDRSLTFPHACHHSVCGACGVRVNGIEKLACITPIGSVTTDGGMLKLEPLRSFKVVSDLVVDLGPLYGRMADIRAPTVLPLNQVPASASEGISPDKGAASDVFRLVDCIECGCCLSACPIVQTTSDYLGPAVLAGAQQIGIRSNPNLLDIVDSEDGVWRCHSAQECTAVCPAAVEPAWRIMNLRRQIMGARLARSFAWGAGSLEGNGL
jgi:succinate dehydrogenase / fumarate reductase iron-sulfur subunit